MPKVDLIFDGDSITAGWKGGGGGIWGHRYAKLNAFDFANSGDTTTASSGRCKTARSTGFIPNWSSC